MYMKLFRLIHFHHLYLQCCKYKAVNCLKFFVDCGAPLSEVTTKDYCMPLHYAVMARSAPIVQLLITRGAVTNYPNKEGKTPLDIAQEKGFVDIVRLMESLLGFFVGTLEKRSNSSGIMSFFNNYAPKWVVVMNKQSGDHYPEGGRLIYYDNNSQAMPRKIFPLYGAKLSFEEGPESLIVTITTLYSDSKLKLRAPDLPTFQALIAALTGQPVANSAAPPAPVPDLPPRPSVTSVPPPASAPHLVPVAAPAAPPLATHHRTPSAPELAPVSLEAEAPSTPTTAEDVKKYGGECTVCMDAPQNAILVPCGHNAACVNCGKFLQPYHFSSPSLVSCIPPPSPSLMNTLLTSLPLSYTIFSLANTLLRNKQPCVICRKPISQVIRFFPV
jgi:hypothetical protein